MASCEQQLSPLGGDAAASLCDLVARINTNFDAAAAAIDRLQNAARATEGRIRQLAARERALQQQLAAGGPPAQQQQLQRALDDVRQERQQQQRELQQMQGKVKEYYDLQELLESIRAGTDGLRRKAASIPVGGGPTTLGAYDAFRQHSRPQWRPGRPGPGYRPALKRDVLGRILPKTAPKAPARRRGYGARAYRPPPPYGSYRAASYRTPGTPYGSSRGPGTARATPYGSYRPVRGRRSGITPNVPEWKRQVADQQQAAARLRRWA
jgi:hypothetical protein